MISALTPTVGASGAIYGLLVAFAFMFPNAELALMFIPVPIKAKYFVPAIVLLDLFSGVTGYSIFGGGIAHFAHVGGAAVGFLMMRYWKKNQFNNNRWDRKSF
jgi:membrane associated rhomboid family serine protease